jgi:hypothetical protein
MCEYRFDGSLPRIPLLFEVMGRAGQCGGEFGGVGGGIQFACWSWGVGTASAAGLVYGFGSR